MHIKKLNSPLDKEKVEFKLDVIFFLSINDARHALHRDHHQLHDYRHHLLLRESRQPHYSCHRIRPMTVRDMYSRLNVWYNLCYYFDGVVRFVCYKMTMM